MLLLDPLGPDRPDPRRSTLDVRARSTFRALFIAVGPPNQKTFQRKSPSLWERGKDEELHGSTTGRMFSQNEYKRKIIIGQTGVGQIIFQKKSSRVLTVVPLIVISLL